MNNDLIHINTLPPFKRMCVSIGNLPTSFMESMTYYEALEWLYKYLADTIIPTVNNTGEAVTELQAAFITLKDYVDNYFENLDVQDEIDNKLDAMAESGELQEIIDSYLSLKALITFDNVASMKESTNLVDGSYAKTLGYYSTGDGGESLYKIRTKEIGDTTDEKLLVEISDSLVAQLIINNQTINIKQFGAKGNGTNDDTAILNYALSLNESVVKKIILNEKYLISTSLNITSNKEIIGVKANLQYNDDILILTNNDIVMLNMDGINNTKIANINLKHPYTNTSSVINFSKSRYIKLENLQCYHDTTNLANCIALDDTINQSSSGFSGYIELKNVRASYYNICLKSKATLIDLKNCVFNYANDYNIYFLGEICGIENCDISHSTSGKAIKTESEYDLNIVNSYLEGFYIDRCIENTKNININIKGSKFYIPNGVTAAEGKKLETNNEYPQLLRNIYNNYQAGNPSLINLIPNGKFDKGTFGWTFSNANSVIMNKSELLDMDVPHYIQNVLRVQNGNFYVDINEPMNVGDYITLSYWIYIPSTSINNPYINIFDQNNQHEIINDRPTERDRWVYHTSYAKINSYLTNGFRFKVTFGETLYISGISLMKGINSNIDSEYTPNSKNIATDNLIIKGTDNKYYKLVFDGTNLTFTEVNKI